MKRYVKMSIGRSRYSRRICIGFSILFLIILFIYFRIFKQSTIDDGIDRPEYCDKTIIQKHFIDNKSPEELFKQNPIRTEFTYEIANENFCSTSKPDAIIFIVSKSTNFDSRSAIRRTWGNFESIKSLEKFSHLNIRILFLIDIDDTRLININLEYKLYQDIVQVRLPQHYTLSTYRDMSILHWTEKYCSQTLLTIKTDDDIFLNTYLLSNFINRILMNMTNSQTKSQCSLANPLGIIYGIKIINAKVVRHSDDPILEGTRYIVTDDEYPCIYYPHYMSGFGYVIDANARSQLVCAFFRISKNPFHMSDVYVTGILPEYLSIKRKHLGLSISYRSTDDCEEFFSPNEPNAYACASSLHYNNKQINVFQRFYVYWQRMYQNRFLYINRQFRFLLKEPK